MKSLFVLAALCLLLSSPALAQSELECPDPLIPDADPTYFIGQGDVHFARGDFSSAVRLYTCAIDLQPDFAPTYASRGYAFAALQDSDSALADYEQALQLDESLLSAYNNRGTLYANLGNFGLAINDFTLVLALDPNNVNAFNNRGVVHAAEGNYDLAIADFQQAIDLNPQFTTPYASLAAVYSALASQNYQRFMDTAGREGRLPAGTPIEVLTAVDNSLREGTFTVWLSLLTPTQ